MANIIKKIFWYPFNSKQRIEELQERIRRTEWESFKSHIPVGSSFLDVGCGAGHNLLIARDENSCTVIGLDPNPGNHGVGRFSKNEDANIDIIRGEAESLPFESESQDIVFCSHVIEHVHDEEKTLAEINRVLKQEGTAIIGMPTATMAWIQIFSHYFFTTHRNVLFAFKAIGKSDFWYKLRLVFIPGSHSYPRAKTVCYDINHYRVKNWKKLVDKQFEIIETIQPLLYPYPDYIQFFKMKKSKIGSSSVFFICKKK